MDAQIQELAEDFKEQVNLTIAGKQSKANIDGVMYSPFDLFECIFFNQDEDTLRLLMAYDVKTKEKIISEWCYTKAYDVFVY